MRLPDPAERPTLTVEEAAKLLGIGRTAAYECVRRGELPVLHFGRRLLVSVAELRRLVGIDPPLAEPEPIDDRVVPLRRERL